MIAKRTTAMIAAMALLGAVTPAAFGQFDTSLTQTATNNAAISATGPIGINVQDIDQGICQVGTAQGGLLNTNVAVTGFESDDCS